MNNIISNRNLLNNTAKAFGHKSTKELKQTEWLFLALNNRFLVKVFAPLTVLGMRIGLPITPLIKKTIFKQFCGGETIDETKSLVNELHQHHVASILDYSIEGKQNEEDFNSTEKEVIRIIQFAATNPGIPYTSLKITGVARFELLEKLSSNKQLTKEDENENAILNKRIEAICQHAYNANVPIYFDAEESWIQPAIDKIAESMMEKFNKEKAIVLTTLQMYRHDRIEYLKVLIKKSRENKRFLGIKLVRGAYWEKENKRAHELNYTTPVHRDKYQTDKDFDAAVLLCLENIDIVTLCAGTHNETSTLFLINYMKKLNIRNSHPNVYFSQLYGMSDHITYNLAGLGYNVTKYLPYGPVKSVIPYLVRRAEENTSIKGQMSRELTLITQEMKRRNSPNLLSK